MKKFKSIEAFTDYLAGLKTLEDERKVVALEIIGEYVKDKAKSKFGIYQEAVGKFPAWAELAESTQTQRQSLGFSPNDPLYRTGDLMDSVEEQVVNPNKLQVGSSDPIMEWQELGTDTIPPRPVLGPAMYESVGKIKDVLGDMLVSWLTGEKFVKKL